MKVLKSNNYTNINTESLRIFFNEIRRIQPLTLEEESTLVSLAKAGNKSAADKLICSNLRMIITIAKTFSGQPLEDLLQEGAKGLMAALDHYNPSVGVYFHTYATYYIRKYLGEFVSKHGSTVYEPRNNKEKSKKLQDEYEYLRESDPELYYKLTEVYGVSVDSFEDALSSDADSGCLKDVSGNTDNAYDCDYLLNLQERNDETRRLMHVILSPQEEEVLSLRYGLDDDEKQVWEIAAIEGVCEARVRQILHKAALKMQACQEARNLLAA